MHTQAAGNALLRESTMASQPFADPALPGFALCCQGCLKLRVGDPTLSEQNKSERNTMAMRLLIHAGL